MRDNYQSLALLAPHLPEMFGKQWPVELPKSQRDERDHCEHQHRNRQSVE